MAIQTINELVRFARAEQQSARARLGSSSLTPQDFRCIAIAHNRTLDYLIDAIAASHNHATEALKRTAEIQRRFESAAAVIQHEDDAPLAVRRLVRASGAAIEREPTAVGVAGRWTGEA